jgi:hypothetical protein
LFKAAFGQPDLARGELELVLPAELRAQLDLSTLDVCDLDGAGGARSDAERTRARETGVVRRHGDADAMAGARGDGGDGSGGVLVNGPWSEDGEWFAVGAKIVPAGIPSALQAIAAKRGAPGGRRDRSAEGRAPSAEDEPNAPGGITGASAQRPRGS